MQTERLALDEVAKERRRHVVIRELLIAYVVMVVFLFFGDPLLRVLMGIILVAIAIQMFLTGADIYLGRG